MIKNITKIATLSMIIALFSSCATIMSGSRQSVTFNSEPADANVYVIKKNNSDFLIGKTPCTVELSKKTQKVAFRKEGYYDVDYKLDRYINGWYFGNLLFGGLPGMSIDLISGASSNIESSVKVQLNKK